MVIAHATGEPVHVTDAMVANAEAYEDVRSSTWCPWANRLTVRQGMEKHFRHNAFFLGGTTRAACAEGRADITPVYFSKEPELLRTNCKPDVALVQVTPPDEHGYVSLGISVDYDGSGKTGENGDRLRGAINICRVSTAIPLYYVSEISDREIERNRFLKLPNLKITEVEEATGATAPPSSTTATASSLNRGQPGRGAAVSRIKRTLVSTAK